MRLEVVFDRSGRTLREYENLCHVTHLVDRNVDSQRCETRISQSDTRQSARSRIASARQDEFTAAAPEVTPVAIT